jgi:hypothetical protein
MQVGLEQLLPVAQVGYDQRAGHRHLIGVSAEVARTLVQLIEHAGSVTVDPLNCRPDFGHLELILHLAHGIRVVVAPQPLLIQARVLVDVQRVACVFEAHTYRRERVGDLARQCVLASGSARRRRYRALRIISNQSLPVHPSLAQHMHGVIMLMKTSGSWGDFMNKLNIAAPEQGANLEMPV